MKSLAIIPARGGSKRIPRKNIKEFMGRPIIAYSIEAAINSGLFDEVMVSTDDLEIAQIARECGAKVPFLRSAATSNDYATTADVLVEVINEYAVRGEHFDTFCCLYPTAPFLTSERLQEALKMITGDVESVFTAVRYSYPVQRSLRIIDGRVSMVAPQYLNSRSQDLEPIYHDAGQFYMAKTQRYMEDKTFWGEHCAAVILSELEVQDLDTETDWKLAELKYKLIHNL